MIWAKSVLAGLAALVLTAILLLIGTFIYGILRITSEGGSGEFGVDLVSMFHRSLMPWIVVLAAFAVGFYWEFRRASR